MTDTLDDQGTDWISRVAILGVGLLGGSVAFSLKRRLPDVTIVGLSRSAEKRQRAIDLGAIDIAVDNVAAASEDADVIVVAAPVTRIASMANESYVSAPDACLITDVGSTKAGIVRDVPHANFVAAHPIAGSEKTGVENGRADLFDGKVIVITPSQNSDTEMVHKCDQFWRLTGGHTVQMSATDHDTHLASVSHVPHLMSALVARLVQDESAQLVGSGWRDITRVAAGDPVLWQAICDENREAILTQLDRLAKDLSGLRKLLSGGDRDGLLKWLQQAKQIKESTN